MCLQIHLRRENHELLCLTLAIEAHIVILTEVVLQRLIVDIVMWVSAVLSVAQETSLVLLSAVNIQLIISIESLSTEAAKWMTLEARLIHCSWVIVSLAHMFLQVLIGEQRKLVCKDLLVPRAEITHLLVVYAPDMAMQIWPSSRRSVASWFWAVVVQEVCRVRRDLLGAVFYADVVILYRKVAVLVILEVLVWVLCEDDVFGFGLRCMLVTVCSSSRMIILTLQCAQSLVLYNARIRSAQIWHIW